MIWKKPLWLAILLCIFLFTPAEASSFTHHSYKEAERELLWVCHISVLAVDWGRIWCLRCVRICNQRNMSHGWNEGDLPTIEKERGGDLTYYNLIKSIVKFINIILWWFVFQTIMSIPWGVSFFSMLDFNSFSLWL